MNKILILIVLLASTKASAVFVNHKGFGEALIIPYYTVNNDLNMLASVTNNSANPKAIKITFREGLNGHAVLTYNVYLDAFDTWTFVLVASESTIEGNVGERSVTHYSSDLSCAPFLNKLSGQEFLPFALIDGPQSLSRAREGYIEILEMGELTSEFAAAVDIGSDGVPEDCDLLELAWQDNGQWSEDPLSGLTAVSGGLSASADLINVREGINYSLPVVALADFYPNETIKHVDVGDIDLSLDAAKTEAVVFKEKGFQKLTFDSGIDAVSAVLMAEKITASYVLEVALDAQTDLILTQPTRRFYFTVEGDIKAPFNQNYDETLKCSETDLPSSTYGGIEINETLYDRGSQKGLYDTSIRPPPPSLPIEGVCGSVYVFSFSLFNQNIINQTTSTLPRITGSKNYGYLMQIPFGLISTENGFADIQFQNTRTLNGINSDGENIALKGVPIMGMSLFRFTNAGAADGLLAQYGGTLPIKKVPIIETVVED